MTSSQQHQYQSLLSNQTADSGIDNDTEGNIIKSKTLLIVCAVSAVLIISLIALSMFLYMKLRKRNSQVQ